MALSQQVEESLREAQGNLRNALSFAARTEKPYISKHIADMLANVDNLIDADEVLTMFEERFRNGKDMDLM